MIQYGIKSLFFGWTLLKLPIFRDLMICIRADFERKMSYNIWTKFVHSDNSVVAGPLEAVEAGDPQWPLSRNIVYKLGDVYYLNH